MAISYRPYEPQQEMLLPALLQDWLPRRHLAYFVSDTADALELGAFYARYAGGGARNQPFRPAMMVKLLVYGYATGVFSSIKIERQEVRLTAIIEARERLEMWQRDADLERGRTEADDRKPRDEDGNATGGRYTREFGGPEPKARDNFTDPDSRIMKRAGGGFDASYNAQTAVDDTAHIIVAADLSNNAADVQQLVPMLQAVKTNTGEFPRQGLADAGYRSEDNFRALSRCRPRACQTRHGGDRQSSAPGFGARCERPVRPRESRPR